MAWLRQARHAVRIDSIPDNLFSRVAEGTHKAIFARLAKGPAPRRDRVSRKLKAGAEVDLYGIVLHVLKEIRPGIQTIHFNELREAMAKIIEHSDQLPRTEEVRRVLKAMAQIASHDESSTPVFDWEEHEESLHMTDPFFVFYLKWGRF